jgi:hypothetical protein
VKKVPQFIQFHFPDFFPNFGFRQGLGCLAHPLVGADGRDIEQLPEPPETGLAKAIQQDSQSPGSFGAASLWGGGKIKATCLAAVTLKASNKAVLHKRGTATSLAAKFHGLPPG